RPQDPLGPAGGQQASLPHQPKDPGLGRANPLHAKARPDLAVPFAQKRRGREHLPDVAGQRLVRVRRLRPSLGRLPGRLRGAALMVIERRPAQAPLLAHPDHTIAALLGRRRGAAHRVDLPATKGAPPRRRLTASRESSRRIVRSPTKAFSRAADGRDDELARLFRLAWPPAKNWSRHSAIRAAVTPNSRDTRSRSSPRSTRSTASTFLREEQRPRSAFDFAMDTSFMRGQYAPNRCPKKSWGEGDSTVVQAHPQQRFPTPFPVPGQNPISGENASFAGLVGGLNPFFFRSESHRV